MSFQQGLSGLNATSKNLEVIGNNVANANTYGAKVARAEFSDMYANALNGAGANQIGIGTNLAAVSQQFTQGNITTTGNSMDLAINGAGFFQLSDGANPPVYSRNGQFKVDRDGFIINNDRLKLMGYPADSTGEIQPGKAKALQLPTAGIDPQATSKMSMELNLKSGEEVKAGTIDFSNTDTYNNATSVTAYDSKGQEFSLTYYFKKVDENQWDVYLTANGESVYGTNAAPEPITDSPIEFKADGSAPVDDLSALAISVDIDGLKVAGDLPADQRADIVTPVDFTLSLDGMTQNAAGFGVTDLSQNGYAPGQLSSIAVEGDGIIMARYSNGQSKPAGQLELATFRNPQGMQALGGNVWARTYASGDPVVSVPGEGNMGSLQSGALEESNIDLTGELVNMITAQRIYQANAQTIKTQDQVLQTLVNLR